MRIKFDPNVLVNAEINILLRLINALEAFYSLLVYVN